MLVKVLVFAEILLSVTASNGGLTFREVKELLLHRGGIKIQAVISLCNSNDSKAATKCNNFMRSNFLSPPSMGRPGYDFLEYLPIHFVNSAKDIYRSDLIIFPIICIGHY